MASPFPGMDPYLERRWGDVHHSLVTYARDQIRGSLPKDLRARVEERVWVEAPGDPSQPIVPDVRIAAIRRGKKERQFSGTDIAVAEPLIVQLDDPITEGYIEIVDLSAEHRLVTVIEFLSPTNKTPGKPQEKYLQKREELDNAKVSLVEIDLLRAGRRLLPFAPDKLPPSYRTPYQVWVHRGWEPIEVEVYRVPLRERLPGIKIPLRETDVDAALDLQALITQAYRDGDYDGDIDYEAEPDPPLGAEDALWADALLRQAGLRTRTRPSRSTRPSRRRKMP